VGSLPRAPCYRLGRMFLHVLYGCIYMLCSMGIYNFKDYIIIELKISHVKIILFLVIVAVLVSGCIIGDGERDYAMSHMTPTDAQSSLITPAATQIPSTSTPPSLYWIKIDPISDKQVGEIFTINSTTNLSVGEEILVQVYQSYWHTSMKNSNIEFSGTTGTAKVIPGRNGTNAISFRVNASEFNLPPQEYGIVEYGVNENTQGVARFNISPRKIP
jgi:PBP1b-binding outer membrane lipoprotein LpoB